MKRAILLHCLTALAAAACGWFWARSAPSGSTENASVKSAPGARFHTPLGGNPAWASQLSNVRATPGASSEIAWIQWAMGIPDAEIPAAIARLNPRSDFHALRYLYARWAKLDPRAAWAAFQKSDIPAKTAHFYLSDGRHGSRGMVNSSLITNPKSLIAARMLESWKTVDPAGALAMTAKLRDPKSPEAKETGLVSWYLDAVAGEGANAPLKPGEDPAAAVAAALKLSGNEKTGAIHKTMTKWMKADARAACAWLRELPDAERKAIPLESVEYGMRSAPPEERAATLTSLLEARGLDFNTIKTHADKTLAEHYVSGVHSGLRSTATAIQEWTAKDPAAARRWLEAQPDGDLKALLAGEAAAALAGTDVKSAIALLNDTEGDQSLSVKPFVRGWMQADARACLEWAGKIPDTALREECLESAALSLASADPELALATARSLGNAETRGKIFQTVRRNQNWNPAFMRELEERFPGEDWNFRPSRPGVSGGY